MVSIRAENPATAWVKTTKYLLVNGERRGSLLERLNVGIEIESSEFDENFDTKFREIFGDDRIDYASSYTFLKPNSSGLFPDDFSYEQIDPTSKWTKTYWGRMISWNSNFNQVEQAIKRLREHVASKTIVISIYDPHTDGRKTMAGMPCLLCIDLKPRDGKLYLTANFRSMAITKSGYADYWAISQLADFLCKQSDLEFGLVTLMAHSCHLRSDHGELDNSKKLLEVP